jgi:hypothetical protein
VTVLWGPSIVGYGTQRYAYKSGREGDMPASCFSPRKATLTLYVGNKFKNAETLYSTLGKHKKSVACLYINKLDDVNLKVLRETITRDYKATLDAKK